MAYVYMMDEQNPGQVRRDADGKTWIYARAGASATAQYGHVLLPVYNSSTEKGEMWATVPWDVGDLGSATDSWIGHNMYMGFNMETVPSDNFGWFQVGGKASINLITAATGTAGYTLEWYAATVTPCVGSTSLIPRLSQFGVFVETHDTSTAQVVYLHGTPCYGVS